MFSFINKNVLLNRKALPTWHQEVWQMQEGRHSAGIWSSLYLASDVLKYVLIISSCCNYSI